MDEVFVGTILASTLRVSVPLILCALAGVLSERSGVIDLGLEGKMLLTAFATASVGVATGFDGAGAGRGRGRGAGPEPAARLCLRHPPR
ncbi:MAG: hypothetical protein V9G29_00065 [Burkholderiaceae bacterium]